MRSVVLALLAITACMISGCADGGVNDPTGPGGSGGEWNGDLPDLPSLAEEQAAIAPTITGMKTALAAGDAGVAVQWVIPESRAVFEASLAQTPELMPMLAAALESAQLLTVSEDDRAADDTLCRIGDVAIEYDGIVFHATVAKVDGTWLFVKF